MFEDPQTRQMNWPKMFRKKSLSDELSLLFSKKIQNLTVLTIIYTIRVRFFGPGESIQNGFRGGTVVAEWISLTEVKELQSACMLVSMRAPENECEEFLSYQDEQVWNELSEEMAEVPEGKRRKPSRVIQDVSNSAINHCGGFWDTLWKSEEGPAAQSAGSSGENTGECSFRESRGWVRRLCKRIERMKTLERRVLKVIPPRMSNKSGQTCETRNSLARLGMIRRLGSRGTLCEPRDSRSRLGGAGEDPSV